MSGWMNSYQNYCIWIWYESLKVETQNAETCISSCCENRYSCYKKMLRKMMMESLKCILVAMVSHHYLSSSSSQLFLCRQCRLSVITISGTITVILRCVAFQLHVAEWWLISNTTLSTNCKMFPFITAKAKTATSDLGLYIKFISCYCVGYAQVIGSDTWYKLIKVI